MCRPISNCNKLVLLLLLLGYFNSSLYLLLAPCDTRAGKLLLPTSQDVDIQLPECLHCIALHEFIFHDKLSAKYDVDVESLSLGRIFQSLNLAIPSYIDVHDPVDCFRSSEEVH